MPESKIEITHRLEREGRWVEASAFRDRVRRERRDAGDLRAAANEKAWEAMAQEYPPIQVSTPQNKPANDPFSDHADDDSGLPENLPVGSATFQSDLMWAYQHIASAVTESLAPSGAAWALRAWGRSDKGRDKFFAVALKVLTPKEAADSRLKDDRDRQFGLLGALSREFAGIEQRCPLCDGVFTHKQAEQTKSAHSS